MDARKGREREKKTEGKVCMHTIVTRLPVRLNETAIESNLDNNIPISISSISISMMLFSFNDG